MGEERDAMSPDALRALAAREAGRLGHDYVGVAHLLIVLFKVSPRLQGWCVSKGKSPKRLRDLVRMRLGSGDAKGGEPKVAPRLETLKVAEPPKRKGGIKVADAKALVDKLRNEAKVI